MGHDDELTFKKIEDVIIKTVISVEPIVNNAVEMYLPSPNQCFELFGFDILIDSKLDPWLLEVNLTPALACDSPLDQKIKSNVIADLLSLAGVVAIEARPSVKFRGHQLPQAIFKKGKNVDFSKREPTYEEKIAYRETEEESKRRGSFRRIFPSLDYLYYR